MFQLTLRRSIATAALALATIAASSSPASAVANGEPVADGQYRFAVKLTMTDIPRPDGSTYDSSCSGALLSRWWVITAGHCFHDAERNPVGGETPYPTTATVGRTDLSGSGGQVIRVVQVHQSPTNDVALAKLARPANGIEKLQLSSKQPKIGDVVRMTGWGATNSADPAPVARLRTGQFKVSDISSTTVGVEGHAPTDTTSACAYDSGAPYFYERWGNMTLLSVESDGPGCPHDRIETTARVDNLVPWIQSVIW